MNYDKLVETIKNSRSPMIVCAPHGRGIVTASQEALGPETKVIHADLLEPAMPLPSLTPVTSFRVTELVRGLQAEVFGGMPIVLMDVDNIQRKDVLDDVRHFLAVTLRPVVVCVHSLSGLDEIVALCPSKLILNDET